MCHASSFHPHLTKQHPPFLQNRALSQFHSSARSSNHFHSRQKNSLFEETNVSMAFSVTHPLKSPHFFWSTMYFQDPNRILLCVLFYVFFPSIITETASGMFLALFPFAKLFSIHVLLTYKYVSSFGYSPAQYLMEQIQPLWHVLWYI